RWRISEPPAGPDDGLHRAGRPDAGGAVALGRATRRTAPPPLRHGGGILRPALRLPGRDGPVLDLEQPLALAEGSGGPRPQVSVASCDAKVRPGKMSLESCWPSVTQRVQTPVTPRVAHRTK